jgi:hypothetical protein
MAKSIAGSGSGTTEVERSIILEPSTAGSFSQAYEEIYIAASDTDTRVVVTAEVARSRGPASEQYIATVRRRLASKLEKIIGDLSEYETNDDFEVYTFPLHTRIVELITTLNASTREGNSREILRMIRDLIGDGGWNRLREGSNRMVIAQCLVPLVKSDFVQPEDVDTCRNALRAKSLLHIPKLDLSDLFEDQSLDS